MRKSLALGLCLGFAWAAPTFAQDSPADFIEVVTVTVKPSAVSEYEDYVKKIVAGATKVGASPQTVLTHQPTLGGPGYTYEIVLPFNNWGELDGWGAIPQILSKAYGDVQGAAILKAGRGAIERSQTAVYRLLRNLSSPRLTSTTFVQLIVTQVDPGMTSDYERYLAKLKAALDQMPGTPTTLRWVSSQGAASTYVTAQFFNKWAERDGAPAVGEALRKAYGEAEARHVLEAGARAVRNRVFYVAAFRPDLSRTPAPATK